MYVSANVKIPVRPVILGYTVTVNVLSVSIIC